MPLPIPALPSASPVASERGWWVVYAGLLAGEWGQKGGGMAGLIQSALMAAIVVLVRCVTHAPTPTPRATRSAAHAHVLAFHARLGTKLTVTHGPQSRRKCDSSRVALRVLRCVLFRAVEWRDFRMPTQVAVLVAKIISS
jgi:hypothetical protein